MTDDVRELLERINLWIIRYADLYEGPPSALSRDIRDLSWQIRTRLDER